MESAEQVRERLRMASEQIILAREQLREAGALMVAGELSACDAILSEVARPLVLERAMGEAGND